jgi:hypothetical protein
MTNKKSRDGTENINVESQVIRSGYLGKGSTCAAAMTASASRPVSVSRTSATCTKRLSGPAVITHWSLQTSNSRSGADRQNLRLREWVQPPLRSTCTRSLSQDCDAPRTIFTTHFYAWHAHSVGVAPDSTVLTQLMSNSGTVGPAPAGSPPTLHQR